MKRGVLLLFAVMMAEASGVNVCPGEGDRYGDFKCNHDETHRVCAKLKNADGTKKLWGGQDFWAITQQSDWSSSVGANANNPGGDWCICMWATANLIKSAGCENVHLECASTDVSYVMGKYTDGGTDLAPAKTCLQTKCGASTTQFQAKRHEVQELSGRSL